MTQMIVMGLMTIAAIIHSGMIVIRITKRINETLDLKVDLHAEKEINRELRRRVQSRDELIGVLQMRLSLIEINNQDSPAVLH